jgi:predicted acyltransferase
MLSPGERLESLDVLRGATIAAMILVNSPGDWENVYPPLLHAAWHGWTFTDLIFPFFLWIAGLAMALSLSRRMDGGAGRGTLLLHLARRAAILFALGLFLNAFPWFRLESLRIPGVLQRIAVCTVAAGAIYLYSTWKAQAAWVAGLLGGYWALMLLVPAPGIGVGALEKDANLAAYVDRAVLSGHMWAQTRSWDPEGILSTIPAIATVLFGLLAGRLMRSSLAGKDKARWLAAGGAALILAGLAMDRWLPINKNLWTSSYSVFMAGMAATVFAACFWLVDLKGFRRSTRPLAIYGMNAIAMYMLAEVVDASLRAIPVSGHNLQFQIYDSVFRPLASPENASLAWAAAFVLLLYLVAWLLYRKRWFLRV